MGVFAFYMQEVAACSPMRCVSPRGEVIRGTNADHWIEGNRYTAKAYHRGEVHPVRGWGRPMRVWVGIHCPRVSDGLRFLGCRVLGFKEINKIGIYFRIMFFVRRRDIFIIS